MHRPSRAECDGCVSGDTLGVAPYEHGADVGVVPAWQRPFGQPCLERFLPHPLGLGAVEGPVFADAIGSAEVAFAAFSGGSIDG